MIIISLIQHFEADFLWKISLKILNSEIILNTFTHEYGGQSWLSCTVECQTSDGGVPGSSLSVGHKFCL